MPIRIAAALFFGTLMFCLPLAAQERPVSGRDLLKLCAGYYDIDSGYCAGYVAAVADSMRGQTMNGLQACNHERVAPQQLVDLIRLEAESDPALQDLPAGLMVSRILAQFYPCEG